MKTFCFGDTNVGLIRPKNEDAFVLKNVGEDSLLAVVIDGVGGNGGGDVAAGLAARCISEHICGCSDKTCSLDILHSAVVFANNSICVQHNNPWLSQMSCVLTAALINLETGIMDVCHVGDTRLYMLKDDVLTKITSDHSVVGPLEESGELSELQAMKHPRRNIITRSVGKDIMHCGTGYIQTHTLNLEPCTLLLCSDGLYDMVPSSRMIQILKEPILACERVQKLIDAALEAGGKDNVTVIVIDLMKNENSLELCPQGIADIGREGEHSVCDLLQEKLLIITCRYPLPDMAGRHQSVCMNIISGIDKQQKISFRMKIGTDD